MLSTAPVANQLLGNILCLKMNTPKDTSLRVLNRDSFRQAETEDLELMLFSSQCRGAFLPAKLGSVVPADYDNPAGRTAIGEIAALAREAGIDAGDMVLAFLLQMSPRIIPLIGPHSPSQMRESMKALEVRLDAATLERLRTISGWDGFTA